MVIKASHLIQRLFEEKVVRLTIDKHFADGELLIIDDCGAEILDREDQSPEFFEEARKNLP